MKTVLKGLLESAGIYYAKRRYMPCGLDWLWDIQRVIGERPIGVVFDVGANIGQTTAMVKARFPGAEVHAFEPVGSTFATLRRNTCQLDRVTCHQLALSASRGRATMTSEPNSPLNSLLKTGSGRRADTAKIEDVETDTVDSFCEARNLGRIDILKVDAEGADLLVLQGASRMVRENRVAFVLSEVGFDPSDQGHIPFSALAEQLGRAGMKPYSFYDYCRLRPPAYEMEGLGLVFANVLFVSETALANMR